MIPMLQKDGHWNGDTKDYVLIHTAVFSVMVDGWKSVQPTHHVETNGGIFLI